MTEWQPIETAPRDGTRIIVYRPKFDGDYIPQVGWDFWMTGSYYSECWGKSRKDCPPTHWMPFPDPPEGAARPRAPKVRTSHRRNAEEAARLQAMVDERYADASPVTRPKLGSGE